MVQLRTLGWPPTTLRANRAAPGGRAQGGLCACWAGACRWWFRTSRAYVSRAAGRTCGVDDRLAQFMVSVGKLCADAHVGELTVRLGLVSGKEVVGVGGAPPAAGGLGEAAPPPESEGLDELDSTGYVDCVWVGGAAVPLSEVVEATLHRPPLA